MAYPQSIQDAIATAPLSNQDREEILKLVPFMNEDEKIALITSIQKLNTGVQEKAKNILQNLNSLIAQYE